MYLLVSVLTHHYSNSNNNFLHLLLTYGALNYPKQDRWLGEHLQKCEFFCSVTEQSQLITVRLEKKNKLNNIEDEKQCTYIPKAIRVYHNHYYDWRHARYNFFISIVFYFAS